MTVRLQGTDGIRRRTARSNDPAVAGRTPQEAFLDAGLLTEQFVELYLYCRVRQLIGRNLAAPGERFVIGWDTRDPEGLFTGAAARGIRKGGMTAVVLGIAPTPAIPLYVIEQGCAGGAVITASHNPAAYNGVKFFTRHGLKLLPGDDDGLSALVMGTAYAGVAPLPETGGLFDDSDAARSRFIEVVTAPANCLVDNTVDLAAVTLIVDAAHGAYAGIAGEACRRAGFGEVIAVNQRTDGVINVRSGVADLEGVHEITRAMVEPGGRFHGYEAIETLFARGAELRNAIAAGTRSVAAAVFDGDGDRFYRVEYDPFADAAFVQSGDETALIAAAFLRTRGIAAEGGRFVNTVESDLSAADAARRLGLTPDLTAVGDKWVLLRAFVALVERAAPEVAERMATIAFSEHPSADLMEALLVEEGIDLSAADATPFAVGGEESGHLLLPCRTERGLLFSGNGLLACLLSFAATSGHGNDARERIARLRAPFAAGFKKTLYCYYVAKERWHRESAVWRSLKDTVAARLPELWPGTALRERVVAEERDMLYLELVREGSHAASLFVRNSGTEEKTGITLRAVAADAPELLALGQEGWKVLTTGMKNLADRFARAETQLLTTAAREGAPAEPVAGLSESEYRQLLLEVAVKQGLLDGTAPGERPTERGRWYLSTIDEGAQ